MVEVAGAGVDLAAGEDAVAVTEDDEVAHPLWWVVGVDRVASGHVQHGLDHDLVVADPGADLGEGGGAELLDLADGEGVGFEVAGVDPDVGLDLRGAGCLGWPVRMPMALTLRTPRGSGVAVEEQLVGDRTDLVVEPLQDEGVAGGFEVGGAEEVGGLGVGEGDVPTSLGGVLAVLVFLGVVGRDGVGDEPVDDDGAAGAAVGELFVDPDRRSLREAVGLPGDPAGLPGRHLQPGHAFPEDRVAVAQVEGVGDQLCPGRRGHAQGEGERLRGERRHGRCPVAAE